MPRITSARAESTRDRLRRASRRADHLRAGGEHAVPPSMISGVHGSPPRGRRAPFLTCGSLTALQSLDQQSDANRRVGLHGDDRSAVAKLPPSPHCQLLLTRRHNKPHRQDGGQYQEPAPPVPTNMPSRAGPAPAQAQRTPVPADIVEEDRGNLNKRRPPQAPPTDLHPQSPRGLTGQPLELPPAPAESTGFDGQPGTRERGRRAPVHRVHAPPDARTTSARAESTTGLGAR